MPKTIVCALYHFVELDNFAALRAPLLAEMQAHGVRGTLLLAHEGINGTISGNRQAINTILTWLKRDSRFAGISYKESLDDSHPFHRTKVKLKKEIVTMGVPKIDPKKIVGTYIAPTEWNQLISDPDVVLVDTRNKYEVGIGKFKNAINPHTDSFREFPQYVQENLDPQKHKKVAMYCTGGIRCEKSTAYLKAQGFDEVYHLQGGILKYLEEIPAEESLWEGECFVFDNRVTVDHDIQPGQYIQCHACRHPITEAEIDSDKYIYECCCPHCYGKHTPEQIESFREREKQIRLAEQRGEAHIGADAIAIAKRRKSEKIAAKEQQRQQDRSARLP